MSTSIRISAHRSMLNMSMWTILDHFIFCIAAFATVLVMSGCSSSFFMQHPWSAISTATSEDIAKVHQPAALRADIDTIVALHERTNPNPYLRVAKDSLLAVAERLKGSIHGPMTRREFLPLVMEMQAAYRSDHYGQGVPDEDMEAAFARGERLIPFRAEPQGERLVVIAVADSERVIEPGDSILRVGSLSAADYLMHLRRLVPGETERYRDVEIRERFRTLTWAMGVTLPTEVDIIRADGSHRTVTVQGVGQGARKTERTFEKSPASLTPSTPQGELLVDRPPFRCLLLPNDPHGVSEEPPIAYIDFPDMDGTLSGQWSDFLDEAFKSAKARGAAGLIVDIRENGGGNSALGDALLERINDRPYRLASRVIWRKSPESDEMFDMMVKPMWRWLTFLMPLFIPEYAKLKQGENVTYENNVRNCPRVTPGFDGPTCLLFGERTFSSAMMLADGVRTYDLMRTIGQPTGGVPNGLGDIGPFVLPNSRIVISFSKKLFIRASGDEADLGPVRPHIEVVHVPGRDASLERAISEISRMREQIKR